MQLLRGLSLPNAFLWKRIGVSHGERLVERLDGESPLLRGMPKDLFSITLCFCNGSFYQMISDVMEWISLRILSGGKQVLMHLIPPIFYSHTTLSTFVRPTKITS